MDELKDWYSQNFSKFFDASKKIEDLINQLLKNEMQVHSVTSRVKTIESYIAKSEKYKEPKKEITDYIGIRIIGYVLEDIMKISDLIKSEFSIDSQKSIDKTRELGTNKMGYRSLHYIVSISESRKNLPEYSFLKDMVFEIQIRTLLEHTWAEIEHDKNYKFSGTLPEEIKRRLNLLSAVLESADNEFNSISNEIDTYAKKVKKEIKEDKLDAVKLNTTSLKEFLYSKFRGYIEQSTEFEKSSGDEVLREMRLFGLITLSDFNKIINPRYLEYLEKNPPKGMTSIGFVRDMMMINDPEKYFNDAWNENSWGIMDKKEVEMYKELKPEIIAIAKKKGIEVIGY